MGDVVGSGRCGQFLSAAGHGQSPPALTLLILPWDPLVLRVGGSGSGRNAVSAPARELRAAVSSSRRRVPGRVQCHHHVGALLPGEDHRRHLHQPHRGLQQQPDPPLPGAQRRVPVRGCGQRRPCLPHANLRSVASSPGEHRGEPMGVMCCGPRVFPLFLITFRGGPAGEAQ